MATKRGQPVRILMVEDNEADACLFRMVSDEVMPEASVSRIGEGTSVIPHLESGGEPPDLIVLDLDLPGMHGLEVLAALRLDPRWRDIPVVIWTSSDRPQDVRRAYEIGAHLFLSKGADLHEVFACAGAIATLLGAPVSPAARMCSRAW